MQFSVALRTATFVSFLLLSQNSSAAEIVVLDDGSAIQIIGTILRSDGAKFASLVTSDVHSVRISSAGGNGAGAIEIAEKISELHLPVEVRNQCASACAQFIAVAASKVTFSNGGFLAFHGGNIAILEAVTPKATQAMLDSGEDPETVETMKRNLAAYKQGIADFEAAHSVDKDSSEFYRKLTSPQSVDVVVDPANKKLDAKVTQAGICDYWVPDREGLRRMGIRVDRYHRPWMWLMATQLGTESSRLYGGPALKEGRIRGRTCVELEKS